MAEQRARSDWPAQLAGSLEAWVAAVRSKTVAPLRLVTRAIVFGTTALVALGLTAALVAVAVVRVLDVYVFHPPRVWASYLVTGALFLLIARVLARLRRPHPGAPGVKSAR